MLSTGAFNALLKTLEEPPKHVIFILATTEPQKLPVTILSRCQRFDFKRISIENIIKRLNVICKESNIEIEDAALKIIAKMSDGAMRDAISILERCIADGDTKITEDKIRELVGIPEFEYLVDISNDLLDNNAEAILQDAEKVINDGKDIEVFIWEEIKFVRDLLMLQVSEDLVIYKAEEKEKMKQLLSKASKQRLLSLIADLSTLQNNMKWASDREVIFEAGLIKIALQNDASNVKNVQPTTQAVSTTSSNVVTNKIVESTSDLGDLKSKTLAILKENHKMIMHTILTNAEIKQVDDDLVHIEFSKALDDVNKQYMQKEESKIIIKETVKKALNREVKIKYVF